MNTYLLITAAEQEPEKVRGSWWSCSRTTKRDDRLLVYVNGRGISHEWLAAGDARPHKDWRYVCEVTHVRSFAVPVPIASIRAAIPKQKWAPPYTNFRGLRSLLVPDRVVKRLYALADAELPDYGAVERDLAEKVNRAMRLSPKERKRRLAFVPKKPQVMQVQTSVFVRDPVVVAEVLLRAGGACEVCGRPAPFKRATDGTPYLEVHHVKQLAEGGADTVENAKVLCPNCHRKAHYG